MDISGEGMSARIASALGVARVEQRTRVDDVDRRYRDAIKAGARPVSPPASSDSERTATLADPVTGAEIVIWSPAHKQQ